MTKSKHKNSILNGYQPENDAYDEMCLGNGQVQPHWAKFIATCQNLGLETLERHQQEAQRQLHENGVTYNVHSDQTNQRRTWSLDLIPLIISEADWQVIEAGLTQRAELLNLILTDIYGPRKLIKQGLLPLELIYNHSGFLRQCDGIQVRGRHQLLFYAADLARGPDGRMWVLGDRIQAPSGAGYALENRMVMNRTLGNILKANKVERLSNFFRDFQASLVNLASRTAGNSRRVVVLTPGPHNETYFEHAYLAAYLGYALVQGDDLTVYNGQVSLKSLEGLQAVDVILRRVDDKFCDPLELRENSLLGVAGLLESARRQNVAIVNPLGSSVLENPALMPFLPGLAKNLLGEALILPSAATWWCGQPKELTYVLDNLDKLIVKQLSRLPHSRTVFGDNLSKKELATLKQKIKAYPYHFIGQEKVSFSTCPSFINGSFEPRHAVLRSFLVAHNGSYRVMPGGLTRSAVEKGDFVVSNRAGGISKDTWVLTEQPQKHMSLWLQSNLTAQALNSNTHLPSRAAENLFWVGRYAERAEFSTRLLRVILSHLHEDDSGDEVVAETLPYLLRALTHVTMTYPGFVGEDGAEPEEWEPIKELYAVILDVDRMGSVVSNIKNMLHAAYAVRNLWSIDTWRVINQLDKPWEQINQKSWVRFHHLETELNQLISGLMAFAGLNMESMTHESGWLLLDMGRRLERAMLTIALVRATLSPKNPEAMEYLLLDAVLRTTENVITYRRRYRSYMELQTVLDLLFYDHTNPRSLAYQFERLQSHITTLPKPNFGFQLSAEERVILDASTRLKLSDIEYLVVTSPDNPVRENLDDFMAWLSERLSQVSPILTQHYFTHVQVPHQLLSSSSSETLHMPEDT